MRDRGERKVREGRDGGQTKRRGKRVCEQRERERERERQREREREKTYTTKPVWLGRGLEHPAISLACVKPRWYIPLS